MVYCNCVIVTIYIESLLFLLLFWFVPHFLGVLTKKIEKVQMILFPFIAAMNNEQQWTMGTNETKDFLTKELQKNWRIKWKTGKKVPIFDVNLLL